MTTLSPEVLQQKFREGIKSEGTFQVGLEIELFPLSSNLSPIAYHGSGGIREFLTEYAKNEDWQIEYEDENPIALHRDGEAITLEPSGNVEYVSSPHRDLHQLFSRLDSALQILAVQAKRCGFDFFSLGYHPTASLDQLTLVPKSRYDIMYEFMPQVGARGREMMMLTCATQISIDFFSEQDAMRKVALASKLTPFFIALSANSSMEKCSYSGFASRRALCWTDTDARRTGIPEFVFAESLSFQDYVDWALRAPVYYIERDGQKLSANKQTFQELLQSNTLGELTIADWELHLSTLFPWARLKNFIEIRQFDMDKPEYVKAAVALISGLFYSEDALQQTEELLKNFSRSTILDLQQIAIEQGLDGERDGLQIREFCRKLLDIASLGLQQSFSKDLIPFLTPLREKVSSWSLRSEQEAIHKDSSAYIRQYLIEATNV